MLSTSIYLSFLSPNIHVMRPGLVLLFALGAPFGVLAQSISDPLRGVEIVSDADRLDVKREGSARFFDPKDGKRQQVVN